MTDADRIAPPGVGGAEKHGARGSEMPWPTGALVPRCAKMCQVPSYPQGANQPHVMHQSEGSGGCSFSCHIVVHVFSWQARFGNKEGENNRTFQTEVTTQTGDGSTIEQFWKEAASEMCSSSA